MEGEHEHEAAHDTHSVAMQAAHEGRLVQLARLESYILGQPVDFKNHQGTSFPISYSRADEERPKTSKLKFSAKETFFDCVANSDEDLSMHASLRTVYSQP